MGTHILEEHITSIFRNQRAADGYADPEDGGDTFIRNAGLHRTSRGYIPGDGNIHMLHICVSAPISKLWQKVVEKCTASGGIILRIIVTW
jgi:hypothetical protein